MAGETAELTLEKPIFSRSRFVRKLTIRAPTQAEIDEACAVADSEFGRGLAVIAIVSGVDPRALTKLSEPDLLRVGAEYERITGA